MLVSKQWLQEYVEIAEAADAGELADLLTAHSVEVEGFEDKAALLDNVVVGRVVSCDKHPNADALQLCHVDIGEDEPVQIVCGGSNVRADMLVPLAKIGAKVRWHGEGDLIELAKTKIRGEYSYGMICASDEIGLAFMYPKTDEKEILDLGDIDASPGTPLARALNVSDVVFDIDNKTMSHRPDLWGHYGIAREVAALQRKKLKPYTTSAITSKDVTPVTVEVKDKLMCPRYMAVLVQGVEVGPSPEWMQKRLRAVGLRPINNIVDITNYVMHDIGQPMHAFDADHIQDNAIIVRNAEKGETMKTLDETDVSLKTSDIVIADTQGPIALAGIMGGHGSQVTDSTRQIIFESANFDATAIRRTSTRLGIRTDSSSRFEKSLDPHQAQLAIERAVALIKDMCPHAEVASALVDQQNFVLDQGPIQVSHDQITSLVGVDIPKKDVVHILERLGFGIKEKKGVFHVTVPSWRATKDICIAQDIIEEVLRVYGYDQVPETLPAMPLTPPKTDRIHAVVRTTREHLAYEAGLTETYSYSFVSPKLLHSLGIDDTSYIRLDNPIAKDRPLIRQSLIPTMLEQVESNAHRFDRVALFEVGKVFLGQEPGTRVKAGDDRLLPRQHTMLGITYTQKGEHTPFFAVSEVISRLCKQLGVSCEYHESPSREGYLHPHRYAHVVVNHVIVGYIAELHPAKQQALGIDHAVACAHIDLTAIAGLEKEDATYTPIPAYPSIERDIACVLDVAVKHKDIIKAIEQIDPLIEQVELFDVYTGEHVTAGKKSMAYHIVYRSLTETLKTEAVDTVHAKVVDMLGKQFGATLRS